MGNRIGNGVETGHGVGLGLAIVARYAALLGARFELGANDMGAQRGAGLDAGIFWDIENINRL